MIRGRIVGTSSGSGGNRGCSRRARKSCASAHRAHTPRSSRRASTAHPSSSPAIHEDRTDGGKKGSVIQYCFVGTCLSESVSERPLCSGYQELLSDPFASRTPFAREGPPPVIVHGRGMNACSEGYRRNSASIKLSAPAGWRSFSRPSVAAASTCTTFSALV